MGKVLHIREVVVVLEQQVFPVYCLCQCMYLGIGHGAAGSLPPFIMSIPNGCMCCTLSVFSGNPIAPWCPTSRKLNTYLKSTCFAISCHPSAVEDTYSFPTDRGRALIVRTSMALSDCP